VLNQHDIEILASNPDCDLDLISHGIEDALTQVVGSTRLVRQNAERALELIRGSKKQVK